ncbi:MAG: FTR1 family protein [Mariprofundaceae bacterium]
MLTTLIILFREALEAMLVIGIAMAASKEIHANLRWIYGGVAGGLIIAGIVALFADLIAASMSGMGQEFFNATVLISASLLMIWTAIWMRKHGKEVSMRIHQTCSEVTGSGKAMIMLSIVVGLAVAREGAEVVLFLHGVVATGNGETAGIITGGLMGLLLGILVAVAIYKSLVRVPVKHLFSVVTFLIVLLAAGMASQGVAYLVMVDALPALGQTIWNTSSIISDHSMPGQVLHALMGYDDRPSGMQALTFIAVLSITWLAIRVQNRPMAKPAGVAAAAMIFCAMISLSPTDADAKKVYSPIVEAGEVELEYSLDYSFDSDPAIDGSARHQFEFEYGVTDRWMTAIYGDFRKRPGQSFAYQGLKWDNIYQLFEQGERWLDAGLYVEYIIPESSLNKPDVIEFKMLLEKESGKIVNTANLILKKELGANATTNTTAGYAWRSKWRWMRQLEPAIEIYGSLGEVGGFSPVAQQSHQIGPVLHGKLGGGIGYEVGYLFGLTSGSDDGVLKLIVGYEF